MTMTATEAAYVANIKNFERSYKSMWEEIGRARKQRDDMYASMRAIYDFAQDLATSMRHDMGDGTTKVSMRTMESLQSLERRLNQIREAE